MTHRSAYPDRPSFFRWIPWLLVALIVLAFFVGRVTAPDRPGEAAEAAPEIVPATSDDRSETGALRAATTFARLMAGPSGDASDYLEQAEAIAAPDWQERARELAQGAIDFINERYGVGGKIAFEPIRYRVQSHSPNEAVIDIWGVVLASGPEIVGIEESWITGTLNLEWVGSQWKVAGQSSRGGPTPELLRTDEEATVNEILSDFSEYGDELDS